MDRLIAMRSFVNAVERGSLSAAAVAIGVSPAMVGNHVRYLERRLGAALLNRTTRRQSVTEFGQGYYERCRFILLEIEAAEASAATARMEPRGLLRVTAPLSIGTTTLPPIVASYLERYPGVHVDLVLSETRLDLLTERLDVAIRIGALPDSGLIARALPPVPLVLCASPRYLAARGTPRTAADLAHHECLDYFLDGPRTWRFDDPDGETSVPVTGRLRIDNGQALRRAALVGLGVIMPPLPVVAADLASGRLVELLPDHHPPALPLHVLTLPATTGLAKVRRFVEALISDAALGYRAREAAA